MLGVEKMNGSNSKKAVELGWSDRGPAPAPRFQLQHQDFGSSRGWRSGARQSAWSWGGPEKGQREWGEVFPPPRAACRVATANLELLVFKMAHREACLLPQRYVNEHPVKKLLGNFK